MKPLTIFCIITLLAGTVGCNEAHIEPAPGYKIQKNEVGRYRYVEPNGRPSLFTDPTYHECVTMTWYDYEYVNNMKSGDTWRDVSSGKGPDER